MFSIWMDSTMMAKVFCTKGLRISIMLIGLALLPACATVSSVQTEPAAVANVLCKSDTDIFCVESKEDAAARLNQKGIEQGQEQNFDQALDLFKQAIELESSSPEYHYNLGVTYNGKQMPVETEAAYIAGVAMIQSSNPQHTLYASKLYFNLACLYALQGRKDEAFEQLEKMYMVDASLMFHWVEADADLDSLRADPRFIAILARQQTKSDSSPEETGKN